MITEERIYYLEKGKMKLLSRYRHTYKINEFKKLITKLYRIHPYAKKLNDEWICGDYRIDQQRPQRKVYSEYYLKIISISEMEKKELNKLIKEKESQIDYPTVWDDGENRYYEDTIHCPKCGKRRKVLTSHTHCEFCGFDFRETKKCSDCGDLSLKNSDYCNHCGYDFVNKISKKKKKNTRKKITCSECRTVNNGENKYCIKCGHKLKKIPKSSDIYKKYCTYCGKVVKRGEDYCNECGNEVKKKVKKEKICPVCGEWNDKEDEFCWNCGHEYYASSDSIKIFADKKCPNCKSYYKGCYQYCQECGTKLISKYSMQKVPYRISDKELILNNEL